MHKVDPRDLDRSIELVSQMRGRCEPESDEDGEYLNGLMNMLENIRDDFLMKGQQYVTLERSDD